MKFSESIREEGRSIIKSQIKVWTEDDTFKRKNKILADWKKKLGDPKAEYEEGVIWLSGGVHTCDNGELSPYEPVPVDAVMAQEDIAILDTDTSMNICMIYCGHEKTWVGRMAEEKGSLVLFVGPAVKGSDPDKVFATVAKLNGIVNVYCSNCGADAVGREGDECPESCGGNCTAQ
jgi:hypothetical protein